MIDKATCPKCGRSYPCVYGAAVCPNCSAIKEREWNAANPVGSLFARTIPGVAVRNARSRSRAWTDAAGVVVCQIEEWGGDLPRPAPANNVPVDELKPVPELFPPKEKG